MGNWTPGPWVHHGDFAVRDSRSHSVATLNHLRDGPLIAASPDMHALLTKMRGHLHAQWKAEIDAVLAKAEGK